MDKITESYIDSILHNSQIHMTNSRMSCAMTVTLPNGFVLTSTYPFFEEEPGSLLLEKARQYCTADIRNRIRELEAYHLLSMQAMA